jgi:hypothetical protein
MMQHGCFRHFPSMALDNSGPDYQTPQHIRPLAVSPLTHPEGAPIPWGFLISGLSKISAFGSQP